MPKQIEPVLIEAIKHEFISSKETIKLADLAEKYKVSRRTLAEHSSKDNWKNARIEYQAQGRSRTEAIAAVAKEHHKLDLATLAKNQYDSCQKYVDLSNTMLENIQIAIAEKINSGNSQEVIKATKDLANTVDKISQVLQRSLKTQQDVTGLRLAADRDAAIRLMTNLGYEVVEADYLEELKRCEQQVEGTTTIQT